MKIERRKGFRQEFIALRPYMKVQLGLRLFCIAIALMTLNVVVAAATVSAPFIEYGAKFATLNLKPGFSTDGLTGPELEMVTKLNARFADLDIKATFDKDKTMAEVRAAFPGMFGDDGKPKVNIENMIKDLGEGDTGIRSILKKQGEELLELKGKLEKSSANKFNLREMINKNMKNIESAFKDPEAKEVVLNVRVAATMTLGNTITGDDLLPEDIIESFSIGAFVNKRYAKEYVFDMASRTTVQDITQYKTWLEEGNAQGGFAYVDEGGLKPLVSQDLVRNFSEYAKVAAKYVVTEELAKFRKNVYAIIQRLISQKLTRDYAALLTTRLLADAAPYVATALDGQYEDPTDFHAIGAVAAQIEALEFVPDLLVLNSQDKWRIGLQQDNDGRFYINIPVADARGGTKMMGFTVRTSNRIAVGNFMLGESGLWEIEDEPLRIRIGHGATVTGGTSNGGGDVTDVQMDLDHNRFRVIVETFFHSWIATPNEGSFVYANFDDVKELLQSV